MSLKVPGSIWVECAADGKAPCPHCGQVGWFRARESKWAGCKHAVGPGTVSGRPALIYRGEASGGKNAG